MRVTRREAAKILDTSYENVKRLQRIGKLHSDPDRHGVHRFDRREVEELARRRGLQITPSGQLAAAVFALFKQHARFEDIVIATQQQPETIRTLWEEYNAGFGPRSTCETDEEQAAREHEQHMHALDRHLAHRRRLLNADARSKQNGSDHD
jgi:hypothetical protein